MAAKETGRLKEKADLSEDLELLRRVFTEKWLTLDLWQGRRFVKFRFT